MRKFIRNLATGIVTTSFIFATVVPSFAATGYTSTNADAGSTGVYAEVGFAHETSGYASVETTADCDITIDLYCENVLGDPYSNSTGVGQTTYASCDCDCQSEMVYASANFNVSSDDGSWSDSLSQNWD